MTIGEVINSLAIKAGIATDDAKLKSLLAAPELATITIDDSLVTALDNGLLSIDAAKNNHPDIKKKYFADAYDGMDKQLLALVAADTFDQTDIDEIKAEKSTSKKAELIVSKLKAAAKSAKGADKDEINRQLTAAHEAARLAKAEVETVKNTYEGKIKGIQLQAAIDAVFGNYKTIYDDMPPAIKKATLKAIVDQALQDKKAQIRTDENGNMELVSQDGSSNVFSANHVPLTPQTFAPILKVSGPTKPVAPNRPTPTIQTDLKPAERFAEASSDLIRSHADQVIADMAAQPAPMI